MRSSITSTAPPSSSTGSQRCGPSWCCACSPRSCASTAGTSWSATASRSPSAAARCRRSSSCISSPTQTVIDERIVAARIEVQRTHDGGDAEQLRSHREACHGGGEPQEGSQVGERRAQHPDRVPPEHPQRHRADSLLFLLNDVVTLEGAVTMLNLS